MITKVKHHLLDLKYSHYILSNAISIFSFERASFRATSRTKTRQRKDYTGSDENNKTDSTQTTILAGQNKPTTNDHYELYFQTGEYTHAAARLCQPNE